MLFEAEFLDFDLYDTNLCANSRLKCQLIFTFLLIKFPWSGDSEETFWSSSQAAMSLMMLIVRQGGCEYQFL